MLLRLDNGNPVVVSPPGNNFPVLKDFVQLVRTDKKRNKVRMCFIRDFMPYRRLRKIKIYGKIAPHKQLSEAIIANIYIQIRASLYIIY